MLMNTLLKTVVIVAALSISACGVKQRVVNLKDRLFNSEEEAALNQNSVETPELTGVLLVLDPERCPLVEGCGPVFSLMGRNLKSQVAITGDLDPKYNHHIISVAGEATQLPEELVGKSGYERIKATVNVTSYRLRSAIPYYPFLVEQAATHTLEKFGCELLWDKSYSWTIEDDLPVLKVKMTDTKVDQPQPWVELSFDGNSGSLISETREPLQLNPCTS